MAVLFLALFLVLIASPLAAQPRTDVVTMGNGDRITGEIISLERGQLEFKTDDAGTIYFEWDKIAGVESIHVFELTTTDGRRFLGQLARTSARFLLVVEPTGPVDLSMSEVTGIRQIGSGFWKRLDGSLDVGFSYTRSSQIAQLNVNTNTVYRRPAFEARVTGSATFTQTGGDDSDEETDDDRATLQISYLRNRGQRWYIGAGGSFERNDSLGLKLRSQLLGAVGMRFIDSNSAQVASGLGLAVNDEQPVDSEPTQNIEAFMTVRTSYYRYDRPRTNIDAALQYFPSLSNFGRHRLQLDAALKREIWKDVFLAINLFDTFDSRPPDEDAARNDIGVVLSFGWSY